MNYLLMYLTHSLTFTLGFMACAVLSSNKDN
jgi:hypothetical protein